MELFEERHHEHFAPETLFGGSTLHCAPLLQFVTRTDPLIEQKLRVFTEEVHLKRFHLRRICDELFYYARSLGFNALISAHEVQSSDVPFQSAETVKSGLILVELKRLAPQNGFHVP